MNILFFSIVWMVLVLGPGLYVASRVRITENNPFLWMSVVLGGSLGATMLCVWGLYGLGMYGRMPLMVMLTVFLMAFGVGVKDVLRRGWRPWRSMRLEEWVVLLLVVGFSLGMVYCVVGTSFSAWDAVISWDKWAVDISRRSGIGGYVSGGYPLGIPLIWSVFYRFFLPDGGMPLTSLPGLMLPAMMQVFPLLLGVSLLSACRTLKLSPVVVFLLVFGNVALVRGMVKFVGYVDVPLAAFVSTAMAWICALQSDAKVEDKASGWTDVVTFLLLFAVAFTKGNGFAFLGLGTVLALVLGRGQYGGHCVPALCALGVAGLFFLHQWVIGVWCPTMAETDPFEHALVVMSSHKDLVTPGWEAFARLVDQWGGFYGLAGGAVSRAALVGLVLMLGGGLFVKAFRVPAVWFLLTMGITYGTASYDARNALYLVGPVAVLVSAEMRALLRPWIPQGGHGLLRWALLGMCTIAGSRLLVSNRFLEIAMRPVQRPRLPSGLVALSTPPQPEEDFLVTSKLGQHAEHIYVAMPAYRRLRNGVYPMQQNASGSESAHDLAFSSEFSRYVPPKGFEPVGRATHKAYGSVLHIFRPTRESVNVVVDRRVGMPEGHERMEFHIERLPSYAMQSGVLEICLSQEDATALRSETREIAFEALWVTREDGSTCLRLPYECEVEGKAHFVLETRASLTNAVEAAILY